MNMKRANEILLGLFLLGLIVMQSRASLWARREAPLIHAAIYNFSSSSYDVKQNSARELQETNKVLADAHDLISHTDITLNGPKAHPGLIPQATVLIQSSTTVMGHLNDAAAHLDRLVQDADTSILSLNALLQGGTATLAEIQASLKHVNDLIAALQAQVSDPTIKAVLDKLLEAAKAMADGMQQLAGASTDVHQIADKARETYLKPVNLWWGLVKELLPLAGSAAQVIK